MKEDYFPTKNDTKPKSDFPGSSGAGNKLPAQESIKPETEFGNTKNSK